MVTRSDRLDHVHSDIRGPLYQEALRMESEGINVLKLNTGNPGRFGFKLPNSVRQALALHIDEAVPYCDVRGMAAARNVICTYHIGRGLQGIMPNDVFICNGVSEAASMLLNALIGTGDEILLPSPCYSPMEQQRLSVRRQAGLLSLRPGERMEPGYRGYQKQNHRPHQGDSGHQPEQPDRRGLQQGGAAGDCGNRASASSGDPGG